MAQLRFYFMCIYILLNFASAEENKIVGSPAEAETDIKSEHVDFVLLRMNYLLQITPSEIGDLQKLLVKELLASPNYKAAWEEAVEIFSARKSNLLAADYEVPDEYHMALIAYTIHDNPFSVDFNKQTRELCNGNQISEKYPYKSFFKLLSLAIPALNTHPKFQNDQEVLYRGVGVKFALDIGQDIAFQSFLSTTINFEKAKEYSKNKTLFEFRGLLPNSVYMVHHSKYPQEEEILVAPFLAYEVENVTATIENHGGQKYITMITNILKYKEDPKSLLIASGSEAEESNRNRATGLEVEPSVSNHISANSVITAGFLILANINLFRFIAML